MPDEPTEVVARFLRRADEILRSEGPTLRRGNLTLVGRSAASLSESVEMLEATSEFQALQKSIAAYLGGIGFGSHGWKGAIQNWLRRSGFYHRIAAGEGVRDVDSVLAGLLRELSRSESTVTYFALLEHVSFNKQRMDFQRYEIVQFARGELDRLIETQICADFYPWATVPTMKLARYWWLIIRQRVPTEAIGPPTRISVNLRDLDIVHRYYTELPPPVEATLQELALFRWRPLWASENDPSWHPCRIPICVRTNDHLSTPPSGPRTDTSMLDTEPEFDPDTHEEVGERPLILFHFSVREAEAFEAFIRHEGTLLRRAFEAAWSKPLVEIAANFFAKAFVADGVEQLLWHMTTIEALIGDQADGGTARLARRLAQAIAISNNDAEAIRKKFRELYDFRSELVHGRKPEKVVLTRHLFEAREFARNLLRWYLRLLADIQKAADGTGGHGGIPERKEILRLLDLETEGLRKARWLLGVLPETFPRYQDLLDEPPQATR